MVGVDPGAGGAPDDQNEVFTAVVGEVVGVLSIVTNPDTAVVGLGVDALGGDSETGEKGSASLSKKRVALDLSTARECQFGIMKFRPRDITWTLDNGILQKERSR